MVCLKPRDNLGKRTSGFTGLSRLGGAIMQNHLNFYQQALNIGGLIISSVKRGNYFCF